MPKDKFINPHNLFVGSFVPNWLLKRKGISQGAKLCYARLCQYAGKDAACYPAQKSLAVELGVCERTVRNYVKELVDHKLVFIDRQGLMKSNSYLFLDHTWIEYRKDTAGQERKYSSGLKRKDTADKENQLRVSNNMYSARFEEIWKRYPNKQGKRKSLKSFLNSVRNDTQWAEINGALENYLKHLEANPWKNAQNGSTWFNNWQEWVQWQEQNETRRKAYWPTEVAL
jgi:hypothetical protein